MLRFVGEKVKQKDFFRDKITIMESEEYYIKKGFKEAFGRFFTFGAIYWNLDVYETKYKKWLRLVLYYSTIVAIFISGECIFSVYMCVKLKDMDALSDSGNFLLIYTGLVAVLINALYHRKDLDYFFSQVGRGYYTYKGEKRSRSFEKFKYESDKSLTTIIKPFAATTSLITAFCATCMPLVHYLMGHGPDLNKTKMMYPPLEMYFPFNPHTRIGYITAAFIIGTIVSTVNQMIWGMDFGYMIILASLTSQWRILNDSILKIPQRAMVRYINKFGQPSGKDDIFKDPEYQNCILESLVENIKHHQAILRTKNVISPYISYVFLVVILNCSLLLASNGMILVQAKVDILFFKYTMMIGAEFAHGFFFCLYGEQLTSESMKLFYNLYSIPWYKCNVQVRRTLNIFMMNTMRPAVESAALLKVNASLETFNSILSSSYTYVNLLRKS